MSIVSSIKPVVAARLGLALLIVPFYFIGASALRQDAPGLSLLGSPMILLGALLVGVYSERFVDSLSRLSWQRPICPECFPLAAILESDSDGNRLAAAGRAARLCLR